MEIRELHAWPSTPADAEAIQDRLRPLVVEEAGPQRPATMAGLDVAYAADRLAAAVVVLDATTFEVVEEATAVDRPSFPYLPGLFAFRELPALVEALRKLRTVPDLLVCDGHGLAHPRGFGLACHLGVLTGLPTMGVGKTHLIGAYDPVAPERGSVSPLRHEGRTVGRVVRTQQGVKPVYVSVGHRIDLETATRHLLALSPRFRLPETTRQSDQLSRRALRV
ncbi:MAG: endonuclease V [Streptosporangiaceae bacterium]